MMNVRTSVPSTGSVELDNLLGFHQRLEERTFQEGWSPEILFEQLDLYTQAEPAFVSEATRYYTVYLPYTAWRTQSV